jgi:anaerobic selenocysteine-containing dehydrogenase
LVYLVCLVHFVPGNKINQTNQTNEPTEMDLSRRALLKVLGITAAGAALPGCERETHRLVPYLLPDDHIVPGVANWYASVCGECEAGCGILVRVMEGRAKKIEGNPDHPVNEGKVCARGQAAVQTLYHPDRLRGPLKREGARGEGRFVPITWEEGLALWTEQLRKHRGRAAMISKPLTGSLHSLLSSFFDRLGGALQYYDPSDRPTVMASMQASFGMEALPHVDLAHSDFVLSFGAPFLEHWLSPVMFSVAYGKMRQGRPGRRGRLVQIEPRLSLTAANADRWIPIRPGTEGLLALGIGHLLLKRKEAAFSEPERAAYRRVYGRYPVEEVARMTEVPRETIVHLAAEFSQATAPLAIGGGLAAGHTNGTATLMAINGLNALAGNLGKAGGLHWYRPVRFAHQTQPAIVGEQALLDLASDVKEGRRTLLHLYQSNPLFSCPPAMQVGALFDRASFVVSFSPFLDESTMMADLILPDHSALESWGDHASWGLASRPTIGLQQPVVNPLYDTRSVADVFLEAARRLEASAASPAIQVTTADVVRGHWKEFLSDRQQAPAEDWFETSWVKHLQQGGWWSSADAALPPRQRQAPPDYEPPVIAGTEEDFPFWFLPYPSVTMQRTGAHLPWLQELPDPLTTVVWGSWVEINPVRARTLGITEGEMVRVRSPSGSLEAPAVFVPGIRPDAVAMPIGQGHTAYGRYAKDRGVNPLTILAPLLDRRAGTLASCGTRVLVERTGRMGRVILMDQRGGEQGQTGQGLIQVTRQTQ